MTALQERRSAAPEPDAPAPVAVRDRSLWSSKSFWTLVVLVVWVVVWRFTEGSYTLVLPGREHTELHDSLTGFRDSVLASRETNPVVQVTYQLGAWFRSAIDWLSHLLAVPNLPRPVPEIGWLGVIAVATLLGYAVANWRIAILVAASFVAFGVFGYWPEAIELLIITFVAVLLAVLIGLPLAVYYGTGGRVGVGIITTLLDLLQTMPTFVYLGPIVLFFGIGSSGAVACTLLYALPPIIRIAGHGIRHVSTTTIEATDSSGQTSWQRLRKVQLPMARATIVVGLNQTTMAALSMATIAAAIDGPGLGDPVYDALVLNDAGRALVPGALIVVMAVMLDRTTTAASQRAERAARGGHDPRLRRIVLAVGAVVALVCVYLSRTYLWAAEFPATEVGARAADYADRLIEWMTDTFDGITVPMKDLVSQVLLDPLQSLLADSPWFVTGLAICALAFVLGRVRALVPTVLCLAGIWFLDLWHDTMLTLAMVLVATALVMALAVVLGVWMARNHAVDLVLRPVLDAGQTIPPYVYLLPALALFQSSRFTAVVAAVVYAAPVAIKLVADGINGVSPAAVEAARANGSTTWQEITKVQLPMSRSSLALATNQGLLYVLSMVVIGGLVGAQALGYAVVLGVSRSEEWGKGAAAGISVVLLGILIDRICRAAAADDASARDTTGRRRRRTPTT